MNDADFAVEAASLVARCTPQQRKALVDMVANHGMASETNPTEQASDRRSMAADARAVGQSVDQMFPGLKRLHGHVDQTFAEMFPDAKRFGV